METIQYKTKLGEMFHHVCEEVMRLAQTKNCIVQFKFNGIDIEVTPTSNAKELDNIYQPKLNKMLFGEKY